MSRFHPSARAVLLALSLLLTLGLPAPAQIGRPAGEDDEAWRVRPTREEWRQQARQEEAARRAFEAQARPVLERQIEAMLELIRDQKSRCRVRPVHRTLSPTPPPGLDLGLYFGSRLTELFGYEGINNNLTYLLFHADQPSETGLTNAWVRHTKLPAVLPRGFTATPLSREVALALRIHQAGETLQPADVLRLALETCDGDLPSALLTAHNCLKELAYGSAARGSPRPPVFQVIPAGTSAVAEQARVDAYNRALRGTPFVARHDIAGRIEILVPQTDLRLQDRLAQLRIESDPQRGDHLGPWYHVFGVLYVASVSGGGRHTAELLARGEGALRHTGVLDSPPDWFKETISSLAGRMSGRILDVVLAPDPDCPTPPRVILSSSDARLIPARPRDPLLGPGSRLLSAGGSFPDQPVDQLKNQPIVFGPVEVESGGRLRVNIVGDPPVEGDWSLGTWNTGLQLRYAPRLGRTCTRGDVIIGLAGQLKDSALTGEVSWPGPGRFSLIASPPIGRGPWTSRQIKQSFRAWADVVALEPALPFLAGTELADGDRIETGPWGTAVVQLPDGSRLVIKPGSSFTFNFDREETLVTGQKGGFTLERPGSGTRGLTIRLGTETYRPTGTRLRLDATEKDTYLRVLEGKVELTRAGEEPLEIAAGQQYLRSQGKVTPLDLAREPEEKIDGIPVGQLLADDWHAAPFGTVREVWSEGHLAGGWAWEDVGADARIEQPGPGVLRITVPDNNDLWDRRTDAPRLLHRVSGDFDLTAELLLECKGNDLATADLLLYAPGSYLGYHAGQMSRDDLTAPHFRSLGGWVRRYGMSKLPLLNTPIQRGVDAPDTPVKVRLSRRGATWKLHWSRDGQTWCLGAREVLDAPHTLWVGWVFKRMAYDRLPQEPAIATLRDLTLTSAQPGRQALPAWDLVTPAGTSAEADGTTVRLSLDGSRTAQVTALSAEPLQGDFDIVARFDTGTWKHEPGQSRVWHLLVTTGDEQSLAYVGGVMKDFRGACYVSDQKSDGAWQFHAYPPRAADRGWLRLTREQGRLSAWYWAEGEWNRIGEFPRPLAEPVFLGLRADNAWEARTPAPFQVSFVLERRITLESFVDESPEVDQVWEPANPSAFEVLPLPAELKVPEGISAALFRAPYPLGRVFFGAGGAAHVFSKTTGKQKLFRVERSGLARPYITSEILEGVNDRAGVPLDGGLLLVLDGIAGGSNRNYGLFQVQKDGSHRAWKLAQDHYHLSDLVPAPQGGWYFCGYDRDNVWHLPREGDAERPLVKEGLLPGPVGLAVDPRAGAVYVLNRSTPFPLGGTDGIYRVGPDGSADLVLTAAKDSRMGAIAWSPGGAFPRGLYVTDTAKGLILRLGPDGGTETFASGLQSPADLEIDPGTASMVVVCDGRLMLWLKGKEDLPIDLEDGRPARPQGEIVRYPKILQFRGDYAYAAYQNGVILRDNASGEEAVVWTGRSGQPVRGAFQAALERDARLAERLGQALTEEVSVFRDALRLQLFQGGAMACETSSGVVWWGYHEMRKGAAEPAPPPQGQLIPLPRDPRTPVITLDYQGGYSPPRRSPDPFLIVYADGSVVLNDPFGGRPAIRARLRPENLQSILRFALVDNAFFSFDSAAVDREVRTRTQDRRVPEVVDLPTTILRIRTAEREHEARCRALPYYAQQLPQMKPLLQLQAIEQRLTRTMDALREDAERKRP